MALTVKIHRYGSGDPEDGSPAHPTVSYTLKADDIAQGGDRTLTILPLPGAKTNGDDVTAGEPVRVIVDLGYTLEQFTVRGIVDLDGSVNGDDGNAPFPARYQLYEALVTWWSDGNWAAGEKLPRLEVFDSLGSDSGGTAITTAVRVNGSALTTATEIYQGAFRRFSFNHIAGRVDRFDFQFEFAIRRRMPYARVP